MQQGAVAIDGSRHRRRRPGGRCHGPVPLRRTRSTPAGQIVLPGLINTHTHAPMVLYRGLADDLALSEWLEKYIFPAEAKTVSPEFVRAGTRLAALEMIESGTTTYADMYYFEEEIARETKAAGLRGVLGQTVIQLPRRRRENARRRPGPRRGVHQGVRGRRADYASRCAPRDLHAGRRDAPRGARSVPPPQRADADPPGRDERRGEERAKRSSSCRRSTIWIVSGFSVPACWPHMASG